LCDEGFFGDDCGMMNCKKNCTDNGKCNHGSGLCDCSTGFFGDRCEKKRCPLDCAGHGTCNNGRCKCV
jgi:syndecan 4